MHEILSLLVCGQITPCIVEMKREGCSTCIALGIAIISSSYNQQHVCSWGQGHYLCIIYLHILQQTLYCNKEFVHTLLSLICYSWDTFLLSIGVATFDLSGFCCQLHCSFLEGLLCKSCGYSSLKCMQRQQPTTNRTKLYKKANYVATLNATVQHGI